MKLSVVDGEESGYFAEFSIPVLAFLNSVLRYDVCPRFCALSRSNFVLVRSHFFLTLDYHPVEMVDPISAGTNSRLISLRCSSPEVSRS